MKTFRFFVLRNDHHPDDHWIRSDVSSLTISVPIQAVIDDWSMMVLPRPPSTRSRCLIQILQYPSGRAGITLLFTLHSFYCPLFSFECQPGTGRPSSDSGYQVIEVTATTITTDNPLSLGRSLNFYKNLTIWNAQKRLSGKGTKLYADSCLIVDIMAAGIAEILGPHVAKVSYPDPCVVLGWKNHNCYTCASEEYEAMKREILIVIQDKSTFPRFALESMHGPTEVFRIPQFYSHGEK